MRSSTVSVASKKAAAKRFKRWVTSEVLPAIRKTGRYEMEQAEDRQIRILKEFQTPIFSLMRENARLEQRLETVQAELVKYERLERELSIHGSSVMSASREWIKKTKH